MGNPKLEIERAAARLNAELVECHDCTMSVFRFAVEAKDHVVQQDAMKIATRMMQAEAAAALVLQRLRSDSTNHTYTYVHEGRPPNPEKSKTNVPANDAIARHATDVETVHRA